MNKQFGGAPGDRKFHTVSTPARDNKFMVRHPGEWEAKKLTFNQLVADPIAGRLLQEYAVGLLKGRGFFEDPTKRGFSGSRKEFTGVINNEGYLQLESLEYSTDKPSQYLTKEEQEIASISTVESLDRSK